MSNRMHNRMLPEMAPRL